MIGIGLLIALVVVVFWLACRRGRDLLNRRFLRFAVIAGPVAIIAVELGWAATEVGRQPWTVWQVLRSAYAVSVSPGSWWRFAFRTGPERCVAGGQYAHQGRRDFTGHRCRGMARFGWKGREQGWYGCAT